MTRLRRLAITLAASAGLIAVTAGPAAAAINHCPPTRGLRRRAWAGAAEAGGSAPSVV